MSAFPKADVQNVRLGVELNVRLWLPFQPVDATLALPVSAGVFAPPVRGQLVITSRWSILHTLAQLSSAPLLALSEPITPPSLPLQNLFEFPTSSAYTPSSGVFAKVLRRPIEITAESGHSLTVNMQSRAYDR